MVYIKSYKGQQWLLPPSLEEMIPEDHVCFLVEDVVDLLDFKSFDIKYSGAGHPAYHPRIIIKLLIMGFLDKIRSSRRLARNARENVVYIYLSEKLSPDFRTISDFRKCNPEIVKSTFKHTVTLAKKEGLLDLSVLSTDGTKMKANASNRSVLSKTELEFISNFIDNELEEWAKQDKLEDDFFGKIRGNDQLPDKSRKKIRRVVKKYILELKKNGEIDRERIEKAREELNKNNLEKVSLTDPESRLMKNKKGKIEFSYNPQITIDKNGFIIANDVCQDYVDYEQLKPQVIQTKENVEELPKNVKWNFDNGYYEGENIHFLNQENIDGYIACQEKEKILDYDFERFIYDKENDQYLCPQGHKLIFLSEGFDKTRGKHYRSYKGQSCMDCPNNDRCTKAKSHIRYVKIYHYEEERRIMKEKMRNPGVKEIYRKRRETTEPSFGDLKENKGMLVFLTRGLTSTRTEFNIACLCHNLQRVSRMRVNKPLSPPT